MRSRSRGELRTTTPQAVTGNSEGSARLARGNADQSATRTVEPTAPERLVQHRGLCGILIAFGHSVLAMSGEETLAQVYREVEVAQAANFKKAAFIVFVYSLVLTARSASSP